MTAINEWSAATRLSPSEAVALGHLLTCTDDPTYLPAACRQQAEAARSSGRYQEVVVLERSAPYRGGVVLGLTDKGAYLLATYGELQDAGIAGMVRRWHDVLVGLVVACLVIAFMVVLLGWWALSP